MEVLVGRYVQFEDELEGVIEEIGGLDEAMAALALEEDKKNKSSSEGGEGRQWELKRLRTEVEERVFEILRDRKAAAVMKEPVVASYSYDDDYLREILEGIELCFSDEVASPPSVTSLIVNYSLPPKHRLRTRPVLAFIANCHKSLLLVCFGDCYPSDFYLVYDTSASSVAIVPPLPRIPRYHGVIGGENGGAAVLCFAGDEQGYLVAELVRHRDGRTFRPTNKATLFTWMSSNPDCEWDQQEVVLPLPLLAEEDTDQDNEPFPADLVFPVGQHNSLAWVDLLKGILLYNLSGQSFEFVPLPPDMKTTSRLTRTQSVPEAYRSMCCFNGDTFKFVAMMASTKACPWLRWCSRHGLSLSNNSPRNHHTEAAAMATVGIRQNWRFLEQQTLQ